VNFFEDKIARMLANESSTPSTVATDLLNSLPPPFHNKLLAYALFRIHTPKHQANANNRPPNQTPPFNDLDETCRNLVLNFQHHSDELVGKINRIAERGQQGRVMTTISAMGSASKGSLEELLREGVGEVGGERAKRIGVERSGASRTKLLEWLKRLRGGVGGVQCFAFFVFLDFTWRADGLRWLVLDRP